MPEAQPKDWYGPPWSRKSSRRTKTCQLDDKKTGATSDVAPAEETALDSVRRQTTRVAIASGRRDNKLTSTKLTSPTAKL